MWMANHGHMPMPDQDKLCWPHANDRSGKLCLSQSMENHMALRDKVIKHND